MSSNITNNALKKDNNENNFKDEIDNFNDSKSSNADPVFSNASYVSNFKLVILMIIKDPLYENLFDSEDRKIVDDFINKLKIDEQTLYVRLFVRRHQWLRFNQINYPSLDHPSILPTLVQKGFLTDDLHKAEIKEILEKLPSPDLKSLCKSLQLDHTKKRGELISNIQKHSTKKNIASFFKKAGEANDQSTFIKERACRLAGICYKLTSPPHNLFTRALTLAYLHASVSDNDHCGQQLIYQMLLSSNHQSTFPEYTINLTSPIYPHRKDLILYVHMLYEEGEVYRLVERKDWMGVMGVYARVEKMCGGCMLESEDMRHYTKLPCHLRTFTPPACYVRITEKAYNVYQTLKRHDDAVRLQMWLLRQPHFHLGHRGRWYDRATLNLSFHLKKHQEAFDLIMEALKDPYVRMGHRLDLLLRATKVITMKAMKGVDERQGWKKVVEDDSMNHLESAQSVTIYGQLIPKLNPTGNTYWIVNEKKIQDEGDDDDGGREGGYDNDGGREGGYVNDGVGKKDSDKEEEDGDDKNDMLDNNYDKKDKSHSDDDDTTGSNNEIKKNTDIKNTDNNNLNNNNATKIRSAEFRESVGVGVGRVEEVALNHYAQLGYTEGIHGEGMTMTTVFFLLSWDIIFTTNITNTFINPFQTHPLDLRTDEFYLERQKEFDALFCELKNADSQRLSEMAGEAWDRHHVTTSTWADWSLFRDRDHVQSLVVSVGGVLLSALVERLAMQMRYVVGGVPDLLVWNPLLHKAMWVEVKGPGDKLSSKQVVWIDFLIRHGADVEVCHVVAKNPKRIERS